jgi:hypothetical protein
MNVHAATEDKSYDMKNSSFYEELERVFYKFLKYHINILFGDFNAKIGRRGIFKSTLGNWSLH